MDDYRLISLSAEDADRIVATTMQVWSSDRNGLSAAEQTETLDFDRARAVEFAGAWPASGPRPYAGLYATWLMSLTVPGRERPRVIDVDALTWVGVHPDHRRRGVLRSMITDQLHRLRDDGTSVAILHASEPSIYGRFGYAIASMDVTLTLTRGAELAAPSAVVEAAGQIRTQLLPAAQAAELLHAAHRTTAAASAGVAARTDHQGRTWWTDRPSLRGEKEPLQVLIASRGEDVVGYAVLRRLAKWNERGMPEGKVTVWELGALDAPALLALGRRLVDFDLTSTVEIPLRTLDDPLVWWAGGPRAAGVDAGDLLWVRLVDLPAALTQRGYALPCDLVLDVTDEFCPANAGRWRLQTGEHPNCEPSRAEPDLSLDITVLAAAYLGGRSIASQAAAGYVTQHRDGAVAALSRAMRADIEPYGAPMF